MSKEETVKRMEEIKNQTENNESAMKKNIGLAKTLLKPINKLSL